MGLALTIAAGAATHLSAHRLDEYLQAARLGIDPDRVELQLDLTPGAAVPARIRRPVSVELEYWQVERS